MTITKETLDKARDWFAIAPSLDLKGIELREAIVPPLRAVDADITKLLHVFGGGGE